MSTVKVTGVAKSFGERQLFHDVSLQLNPGERAALIGRNGTGKSTLLQIIAGLEPADAGTVHMNGRTALLAQDPARSGGTLLDFVTPPGLLAAQQALAAAQANLENPTEENLVAYGDAEAHYRALGGYDFEPRAAAVLDGLGLEASGRTENLSGGELRRATLAALLLTPADLLLLDEPTNHLDTAGREWLEGWLQSHESAVLVVSHDRAFLDAVATRVFELERGRMNEYPGNYSAAMELKRTLELAHERAWEAQERKAAALREELGRLGSASRSAGKFNHRRAGNQALLHAKNKAQNVSNTLARRAKALQTRLERMNEIEQPFRDRLRVRVPLPDVPTGPGEVIVIRDVSISRGGRQLFAGLDFTLRRGEKVALLGPNGSGKSSLLAAILGRVPYEGEVRLGHGLEVFVAHQNGEELGQFPSVEEAVRAAQPQLARQDLFHLVKQVGLPGPEATVSALSGGERTRLALARLAVTRASLLVLDEPTNNLDLEAIEALEELLQGYPGSILFTSHDRRLVERVATRSWRLG